MHIPEVFRQNQQAQLHALMRSAPLAVLLNHSAAGLQASHLPLLLVAEEGQHGTLYGHFARANPHWRSFAEHGTALAVFSGADGYISPSWYPSKAEHGKAVPTWNYQSVHAHGQLELFDDSERLHDLLTRQTAEHENPRAQPWTLDEAPADYIASMLRGVVGFALPIQRLEGQWKLSQNRNANDRAGVQQGLAACPHSRERELAALIR